MKVATDVTCPCGSGAAYQECCSSTIGGFLGIPGLSPEEAGYPLHGPGRGGADQFQGLSPEQMHRLLHHPFDAPDLATFPNWVEPPAEVPMLTLFTLLAERIGTDGVTPTPTGSLPTQVCHDIAQAFLGEDEYQKLTVMGEMVTELEFGELNMTRMVAEAAGLLRRYKGKFIIGRECRKLLTEQGSTAIYPRLLAAYARKYDWAYGQQWAGSPLIQRSFLFSLFLLKRFGAQWESSSFYEDLFLRAFPHAVQEVRAEGPVSPQEVVRSCYRTRFLKGFAALLGLVEIAYVEWNYAEFRVRALPLLQSAVRFHLPAGG